MMTETAYYMQMAQEAAAQITGSKEQWTAFLTTSARLYKYPFAEQLMIYKQRPEATACAEYDLWNDRMNRYVKRSNSFFEPQQHFKRDVDRDNYRISYEGRGGASDWNVSLDYAKMHEDDITLTSYVAKRVYEGTNILDYVDNVDHRQWGMKASANTQLSDNHLLSYGVGFTQEKGEGSRLKNAPDTYTRALDPWDYDKNLYVGSDLPSSRIHDYTMTRNNAGVPKYDSDYEWYGQRDANGKSIAPVFTYQEFKQYEKAYKDGGGGRSSLGCDGALACIRQRIES